MNNFSRKKNSRLPAEFEPQALVQFTFPHKKTDWVSTWEEAIPAIVNIITTTAKYVRVLVASQNTSQARSFFTNTENIIFHEVRLNDTWARDHGGITIVENEEKIILDFIFNGWGNKFPSEKDNLITRQLFLDNCLPADKIESIDFVLEGGSIESDGQGTLLTTSHCLLQPSRNPSLSKDEIENKLIDFFGLKKILWLDHGELIGDDTDAHIDTLARFCNPQTIAYIKCENENDPHFDELLKMEQQLNAFKTLEGNKYNLIPLPMTSPIYDESNNRLPATYANFLITNGAVIAPIYQVPEDDLAIHQLKKAFPNRVIVPVNCRPIIRQGGSLHCLSMQYPDTSLKLLD